ncbi:hypothetical protein [Deinococcus cellulosilyticus]|uniref:Uncharacterized protein n=1 Tax=Deinococcus cellulosilyticus (strain DSM 18568 / NBRC 106333 / KACC 11606 / 5516J-15) TaxID=1223518 RepID=A0A511NBP0_DEIC1|nr:hypothetical protein [Deinococcus cellulosilyticus]GEM49986.1 hypothetical protein DC3_56210 [Deinococcus cellulosilyticus NBRC 106333 = KACC 11606]
MSNPADLNLSELERKQKLRLALLMHFYDLKEKHRQPPVTIHAVYQKFPETEHRPICDALEYLEHEGLLLRKERPSPETYCITHEGLKEAEQAIEFPDLRTVHFSQRVVNIYMKTVYLQQGNNNQQVIPSPAENDPKP